MTNIDGCLDDVLLGRGGGILVWVRVFYQRCGNNIFRGLEGEVQINGLYRLKEASK